MQLTQEQEDLVTYSALSEPGDALAQLIYQLRGDEVLTEFKSGRANKLWFEQVQAVAPEFLSELPKLFERFELRLPRVHAPTLIERAIRWNASPVFSSDLPVLWQRFEDIGLHQPLMLWIAGDSKVLELEGNSIVGTRNPSGRGVARARKLVRQLSQPVVSGGASGIDFAAHRAALDFGLHTVAFMAGGIDRAYPTENWPLFHDIVRSGGVLVSEAPPFTAPTRFRFLSRNRLIAAATSSTFIVEAGYRSGSRNTANHAKACGREVYAIPGSWSDKASQGCNAMIKEGLAQPWQLGNSVRVEPSFTQKRILDSIRDGAQSVKEIALESGLAIQEVAGEIKNLKLAGEFIPAVIKL